VSSTPSVHAAYCACSQPVVALCVRPMEADGGCVPDANNPRLVEPLELCRWRVLDLPREFGEGASGVLQKTARLMGRS
jgi:hypothetical protein